MKKIEDLKLTQLHQLYRLLGLTRYPFHLKKDLVKKLRQSGIDEAEIERLISKILSPEDVSDDSSDKKKSQNENVPSNPSNTRQKRIRSPFLNKPLVRIILWLIPIALASLYFLMSYYKPYEKEISQVFDEGIHYYENKNYREAIQCFYEIDNRITDYPHNHYYLAQCYGHLRNFTKADFHYNKALEYKKELELLMINRGINALNFDMNLAHNYFAEAKEHYGPLIEEYWYSDFLFILTAPSSDSLIGAANKSLSQVDYLIMNPPYVAKTNYISNKPIHKGDYLATIDANEFTFDPFLKNIGLGIHILLATNAGQDNLNSIRTMLESKRYVSGSGFNCSTRWLFLNMWFILQFYERLGASDQIVIKSSIQKYYNLISENSKDNPDIKEYADSLNRIISQEFFSLGKNSFAQIVSDIESKYGKDPYTDHFALNYFMSNDSIRSLRKNLWSL